MLQIRFNACFNTFKTAIRLWDKIPTLITNIVILMHFYVRSDPYGAPVTAQCVHLYACSNSKTAGRIFIKTDTEDFEVLTAVVMKSSTFRDITPCSPVIVNRRFGGTCCLHLQGRRISQARSQHARILELMNRIV
jgi:hypothetical protein